jgi:hypothetical protein
MSNPFMQLKTLSHGVQDAFVRIAKMNMEMQKPKPVKHKRQPKVLKKTLP